VRKSQRREGKREERCFSNEEKVERERERKKERERERERETRLVQVGKVLQNYDVAFLLSRNAHAGADTALDIDGDQGCCLPPRDIRVGAEKFKAPRETRDAKFNEE